MMVFLIMQLALPTWAVAADRYPNLQVVIEAGHGGSNTGAIWKSGTTRLVEKDLTCKLAHFVEKKVASGNPKVSRTTDDTCNFFSTNGRWVAGGVYEWEERLNHIRLVSRPSRMRTLVVSIHIDQAPSTEVSGAFVIVPPGRTRSRLAHNLMAEFVEVGLDRKLCRGRETSIVQAGDCRIKRVHILMNAPVEEMVLIEVANIRNAEDRYRLTSELGLELYSDMIARAILRTLDEYAGY